MTSLQDYSYESYWAARTHLIDDERSLRRDRARLRSASEHERRADEIVRAIKQEEADSIWSIEHENVPNTFPGMAFLSAKNLIMETKIFQILSKMPKGALLHCHLDATVNPYIILELAMREPAMHVKTPVLLTPDNIKATLPVFRGLPSSEFSSTPSLTSSDYKPGTWVNVKRARETFDASLGGPAGFDNWTMGALTINPSEAYESHNTVKKIWRKFLSTFNVTEGLLGYGPLRKDYILEFLRSSIEDGISYIEARTNFDRYIIGEDGIRAVTSSESVRLFGEAVEEVKAEMTAQGRGDDFIGAKIIYTTVRTKTCEELEPYLEDCLKLKLEYPDLIAGFDLVGDENVFKPLIYYAEPLLRFKKRVDDLGLDLPFIFHAGETLGDGSEADNNLYDAILLGTRRIGHGFSLAKHPKLIEKVKERNITIEACPISNEILRLTSSMPAHPLPVLINNGVPVALCSDDPAVFGNMGLSYDFFQVLVASDITGLITLGDLARHSLESSTLSDDQKEVAIAAWEKRWAQFVESIADGTILAT